MRQSSWRVDERAALVVDVREGNAVGLLPGGLLLLKEVRKTLPTRVVFLEASDEVCWCGVSPRRGGRTRWDARRR